MTVKNPVSTQAIKIDIDGLILPIAVERRAGIKNASLRVTLQGVNVRVPRDFPQSEIGELIKRKGTWMARHWRRLQEAARAREMRNEGNQVLYLGMPCRVIVCEESRPMTGGGKVQLDGDIIVVYLPAGCHEWGPVVNQWLRQQAETVIKKRLAIISHKLHYSYRKVSIRDQRTRWGSCSAQRHLSFNWRLVTMPNEVLDYVIVHELCHLQEMRHSPRFWSLVERAMPDFKKSRKWLREHGHEYSKSTEVSG